MTPQCNLKKLCIREPERDKRIRVKPSILNIKKKTLFNKPKLACVAIKDNSINLLEFVFDLSFDEIIFLENPIKIG